MTIAFVHNGQALLPEIAAYRRFFASLSIETQVCRYGKEAATGADVLWYFMGLFPQARSQTAVVIHEYSSASVPPFHGLKDRLKGRLNPRPDFRIFHNEYVLRQTRAQGDVPFAIRDQGVDLPPPALLASPKDIDFIYSGSCAPHRRLDPLLQCFARGPMKNRRLLMLGNDYQHLQTTYGAFENISFTGPVDAEAVPAVLARARYAVNYIADIAPFNVQTSTKLLDYAAMGLPIITTRYDWIVRFEERYGGTYFYLKNDLSNFRPNLLESFSFQWPDLRSWSWDSRIRGCGVLSFLRTRFPDFPSAG